MSKNYVHSKELYEKGVCKEWCPDGKDSLIVKAIGTEPLPIVSFLKHETIPSIDKLFVLLNRDYLTGEELTFLSGQFLEELPDNKKIELAEHLSMDCSVEKILIDHPKNLYFFVWELYSELEYSNHIESLFKKTYEVIVSRV